MFINSPSISLKMLALPWGLGWSIHDSIHSRFDSEEAMQRFCSSSTELIKSNLQLKYIEVNFEGMGTFF